MQYSLDFFAMRGVKVEHIEKQDYKLKFKMDKETFDMIIKGCLEDGFDVSAKGETYLMIDYDLLERKRGLVTVDMLGVKIDPSQV